MDVTITPKSQTVIHAEVNVPWDDELSGMVKAAIKEIAKYAQVPGFRKGKAPAALLKKRFHNEIAGEVGRKLIPDHIDAWVKEKEVRAAGSPRIHHLDMKENDRFHYAIEMDVYPEFELKEWRGLEAESVIVKVEDQTVEEEIERRLQDASAEQSIVDEPAAEGDAMYLQVTALDAETNEAVLDVDRYKLVVGDEQAHPILADMVKGLKAHDEVEDELDIPEDDAFAEWRGKKVKAFAEVLEVTRESKQELDDAFAQSQGAENVEGYRAKIREEITTYLEDQEKGRLQNALVAKLMEDYDFQAPSELVLAEARHQTEQTLAPYMRMMQGQANQRDLFERVFQMTYPKAVEKVRADLVLDKIAEDVGVEISDEDVDKELETVLPYDQEAKTVAELREKFENSGAMESVQAVLKRQKALEALTAEAKVEKVERLTEEVEAEAAAKAQEAAAQESAETADAPAETETSQPKESSPETESTEEK